ncbi:hypothetical protein ASG36_04730 [Geodermatophilus sp. Leaf369]|uniref:flagellar filament capping protein FliD n=1 Tax=Geodermatophilus sp. Leaf369 TaxID=1736354 RepID=UPI0006F8C7D7|nr:flagellar filament capping protein FliD [Geodermatophilus sp. Leaf369]KQS60274.1 hypothetical protein ASG36_04730 [Geodermatophilus sp. Leaf369]
MALGVDGLVSGLDTTSIISGLMAVEARPQTLLKNQLTATQAKATAYRAVNTRFDAIRTAAEALTSSSLSAAKNATSSTASVTASASAAAVNGTAITFSVTRLASAGQSISTGTWSSATAPARQAQPAWPIEIRDSTGATLGSIDLPADATLADAVTAINGSGYGVRATVVQVGANQFRLQISSDATGAAGGRTVVSADEDEASAGSSFLTTTPAQDAELDLGAGVLATSATNTFTDLVAGVSVTVSAADPTTSTTVRVGSDAASITAKVQALVDAANGALGVIKGYTTSTAGQATATLQGDRALVQLSDQVLDAISTAIGGTSASTIGLQLTRDGKLTFDAAVFTAKLGSDPAGTSALLSGAGSTTGIAGRLAALAKTASDSSTGTLVQLATGRDTLAKAIQDKVDAFDIRLEARKATLTRQFSALETALNTIKNQSSWLSSQINQLYNPNASS